MIAVAEPSPVPSLPWRRLRRRILPGFGVSLGYSVFYLSVIVLIQLAALVLKTTGMTWPAFWATVTDPQVVASYKLSLGASLVAALVNGFFGLIIAWVLARYEFPGRLFIDALVDLPFALPTAVAGIALTAIYAPHGPIGSILLEHFGIRAAFSPLGVTLALIFIGIPFVVRTLQPVIQSLPADVEEAAACLGANRFQTFQRVILPALLPAWLTGMTLAFGRAVGEYGSVVFISGNMPFRTEIAPLLIVSKLEQYNYGGAAAIGTVMLVFSLVVLIAVNALQRWHERRTQGTEGGA
jgi:sulfate transport system permease protein